MTKLIYLVTYLLLVTLAASPSSVRARACGACPEDCEFGFTFVKEEEAPGGCRCACATNPCSQVECPHGTVCRIRYDAKCTGLSCDHLKTVSCISVNKDGACPSRNSIANSTAAEVACADDSDCQGFYKCCPSSLAFNTCAKPCRRTACHCATDMEQKVLTNSKGCSICSCVKRIALTESTTTADPVCALPKETGPCRAAFKRFYFDAKTGECKRFTFGGCSGNANNFIAVELCQQRCGVKTTQTNKQLVPEKCSLDKVVGPCRAAIDRFFYNKKTQRCEMFSFGGCGGNENNFENEEQCNAQCQVVVTPSLLTAAAAAAAATTTTIAPTINKCDQIQDQGPCYASIERFFFNKTSQRCESFSYGGCLGNENNFESVQECSRHCSPKAPTEPAADDTCTLDKEVGMCRAAIPRFFFNKANQQCQMFIYGGCDGNTNNFESEQECKQRCSLKPAVQPTVEDKCTLEKEIGLCRASMPRFFFNKDTQRCELFYYGGCDGNANNFESEQECSQQCQPQALQPTYYNYVAVNKCELEKKVGPCRASLPRFFFNITSQQCESFEYGGCRGNENNFETLQECNQQCPQNTPLTTEVASKCELDNDAGPCLAYFERFFFNKTSQQCESFIYGGCQGNENNFLSLNQCNNQCSSKATPAAIAAVTIATAVSKCEQPQEVGLCYAAFQRFFFNKTSQQCEAFIYGGCKGNENNFETLQECRAQCPPKALLVNKCTLDSDTGPCYGQIERFFFNKTSDKCESFNYGGCQGNENNFVSKLECSTQCNSKPKQPLTAAANKCELDKKPGPCFAALNRFFFNKNTRKCEAFTYGGCQGNANNFLTHRECIRHCFSSSVSSSSSNSSNIYRSTQANAEVTTVTAASTTTRIVASTANPKCNHEKDAGPCYASIERYYFNKAMRACEVFTYGGCEGNSNNFATIGECSRECFRKTNEN